MSRGVTWGMVSIPASRWIAIDAISAFIRARAIGLSFTSTKPTAPDCRSTRATSIMASLVPPFGGSSSTLTTHSPSRSARASLVSPTAAMGRGSSGELARLERRPRRTLVVERRADRLDLRRRRAAAAADDPRAERRCLGGEVAEVLGRRVGVDDAPADDAREADVGQGGKRHAGVAHRVEREQRGVRAGAVVRPDRRDVELREPPAGGARIDAAARLGLVVEREQRHDRKRRGSADGLDRGDELIEVEERLDHEQVDAAALEHAGLLGVQRPVLARVEHLQLAERPDRACDQHVTARRRRAPRVPGGRLPS